MSKSFWNWIDVNKVKINDMTKDSAPRLYDLFKPAYDTEIIAKVLGALVYAFAYGYFPMFVMTYALTILLESFNMSYFVILIITCLHFVIFFYFNDEFNAFGKVAVIEFSNKLFFNFVTKKGEAITANDFKKIYQNDRELYSHIKRRECVGKCYYTSYELCQLLKKGKIEYVALKSPSTKSSKPFYIHVLYVNNGWCFDTYSCRQYSLDDYYLIQKDHKVCRSFDYDEIRAISPEEFKRIFHDDELKRWTEENDCVFFTS